MVKRKKKKKEKSTLGVIPKSLFSVVFEMCMCMHTHSPTIPIVSIFVTFNMKKQMHSNERNKKLTVRTENGGSEKN